MDKMFLVITLQKEVEDRDEGKALYDQVKDIVAQYPNVTVQGMVTNHFDQPEG